MRYLSKTALSVLVLSTFFAFSSAVSANDLLVGKFMLPHAAQWNNVMLPAGNYTLKMNRTTSNANVLVVRGEKQTVQVYVYPTAECGSCRRSALNLAVRGDRRVVTSLDLPGFHLNFKSPASSAEKEERVAKRDDSLEHVAVQLDNDNN